MNSTGNKKRIFSQRVQSDALANPGRKVLKELEDLAGIEEPISDLSTKLFLRLRKMLGTPELNSYLLGIQFLGHLGEREGARLLAAYLDVTTAGARLIPRVNKLSNTRRQVLFLGDLKTPLDGTAKEWLDRVSHLQGICKGISEPGETTEKSVPKMRAVLEGFLKHVVTGESVVAAHRTLFAELLRLETDALQERISRLAGTVNPYRVSSVQRILPLLSRGDSDIRDLRQLIAWVEEGRDQKAFGHQGFRALEVLENHEFEGIYTALKKNPDLHVFAGLHRGARDNPLTLDILGMAVARMLALDHQLVQTGYQKTELDLLSVVSAVHQFARGRGVALPLELEDELIVQKILADPKVCESRDRGRACWALDGFSVQVGQLILDLGDPGGPLVSWPHGLPACEDKDPMPTTKVKLQEEQTADSPKKDSAKKEELDVATIKNLVMSNITSVSVLLGFLRNPKVISIPGLVASVAARTRNPQIIETIATDRALYTGFANRDVPLVCLRSACNVSPKILRRFIHVKYVSKVDLRRMASDRAGIRKEVAREIEKYLEALS